MKFRKNYSLFRIYLQASSLRNAWVFSVPSNWSAMERKRQLPSPPTSLIFTPKNSNSLANFQKQRTYYRVSLNESPFPIFFIFLKIYLYFLRCYFLYYLFSSAYFFLYFLLLPPIVINLLLRPTLSLIITFTIPIILNKNNTEAMSTGLAQLMQKLNSTMTSNNKIGSTTTVNEQVDEMEGTLYHFKRSFESQQKQQSELQFQLKKLQQQTKTNFMEMNKEFSDRIDYLSQLFKQNNEQQGSQFEHMEYQNKLLHDQHDKMHEIGAVTSSRTENLENSVGI